ncbi:hypothetical protein [Desulfohalovibrio reitneri]|uniref:hypothetical protein n=1 Tax=Desulfohalovibrio reitneri TaxID=1307759 RepID=UPI0004A6C0DE|nr:hypothetical protein [Desulfohalovibrio reitneri]
MWLEAFLYWLPLVPLAIANGFLREAVLARRLSAHRANQLSCLTLVLLFCLYAVAVARWWGVDGPREAGAVGALWLALTVTFEFGFGHWVAGESWEKLLANYNLAAGRLWVLVLLAVGLLPFVVLLAG